MKLILSILVLIISIGVAYGQGNAVDIYIATNGKDINSGKKSSPVKTLSRAVAVLSENYKKRPFDIANIWFATGIYSHLQTVNISPELFDGKDVSIRIGTKEKEKAQLSGGYQIPFNLFKKVSSPELHKRLHEKAIGKIYAADLKGTGLESAFVQNKDDKGKSNFSFVSWNEYLLQIAQWPNRGYSHISEVIDVGPTTRWLKPGEEPAPYSVENPSGGTFKIEERVDWKKINKEFAYSGDMVFEGYPHNDWFFQTERVGKIDGEQVRLLHHTRYGLVIKPSMIPRRVRLVNLLSELDQPGEWYFDHHTKTFFIYPIEQISAKTHITVLGGETMLKVEGLSNFIVKDVVFENGGDLAIEMNKCNSSHIVGCTFRNFQGRAFIINSGTANKVESCDFYGLYSVGSLSGGDRKTLEPAGHSMINNHIYDIRLRGYGAVGLSGVGIRFAHNLMHDTNGAISFKGNDLVLEYNEFYNMGWEMGDWNVAYNGADWASWGNEVRYNFVHHLMEMPGAYPVEAFRNDDLGMGVNFHGNIFYKSGRGSIAFSGAGNSCINNIALETSTIWQAHLSAMGDKEIQKKWKELEPYDRGELKRGNKEDFLWRAEQIYGKMGWLFEPYLSKYPKLKLTMNSGNPWGPSFSEIKLNYINKKNIEKGFYTHRSTVKDIPVTVQWEYPVFIDIDEAFIDTSVLNFSFKPEYKPMEGFESINFSKIGMYIDENRTSMPNKDAYRKGIKDQFEGIKSAGGKYNKTEAYKRYPVPKYLKLTPIVKSLK